jgi:hypothetical protein
MIRKVLVFSFLLVAVFAANVNGQGIKLPSVGGAETLVLPADKAGFEKDFLAALDPGKDLGISAENLGKLATKNKSFVSDVMGIMGAKGSDTDKLSKIGLKNTDLTKFVNGLLGASTAGKYLEKVKKQMGPFKTKYNLAKLLL